MVKNILPFLGRFTRANKAVSALEYAILVAVIVAGVGGALALFSDNIEKAVGTIGGGIAKQAAPKTPTP